MADTLPAPAPGVTDVDQLDGGIEAATEALLGLLEPKEEKPETEEAAPEDAREAFRQALALHLRTRALKWQKMELERDIAEATEGDDGEAIMALLRALSEVQMELARLENQEAIIDGFGVLSGRVRSRK